MRVVVADDVLIVRAGLVRMLTDADVAVSGEAADAEELLWLVARERPDVAVVDIRMPPTHRDEGLIAARVIRERYPATGVLLLSQYLAPRYAQRLLDDQPAGLGYLLKERVCDLAVLVDALERVNGGHCVVDPAIVTRLLERGRRSSAIAALSKRELQTLALMAEGRSNTAIAHRLGIGERTVESLCAQLFRKLELRPDPDVNRRVLAVLTMLGNSGTLPTPAP
jgi:DNA-binding NarL/FixJ family response regulator